MASKKQIDANRKNAKKSTGPKTEEGKAKSSMNALKHGLTSQRVWLNEEEEMDFREFRRGLIEELEPEGSLETQYVCRIAAQMWRLARVPGIEAELLVKMSYDPIEEVTTGLGEAFHRDCGTYDGSLGRLARYEAILDRSLNRLLGQFRQIQADRIKREKRHAEDWRREDFSPYDAGFRYPGAEGEPGIRPQETTEENTEENTEKNEATEAGAVTGENQANAVRQRKPREAIGGKKANHGGNGIDKTTARGNGRAQQAVPLQPPPV